MSVAFGTKAETLARLEPRLRAAGVLPQYAFSVREWRANSAAVLEAILAQPWGRGETIVRSSAGSEDGETESNAGRFTSVLDVRGADGLRSAIERVVASFGAESENDGVFVQPQLTDVTVSGVAFSRDPNTGAPYVVVNYDDATGRTTTVTGGEAALLKTYYYWKDADADAPHAIRNVVALVRELETLLGCDALDVEFGIDRSGRLWLFQVRRLALRVPAPSSSQHKPLLDAIASRIEKHIGPHPYLHGERTVYGIMPDWNPAEIVGIRPRPLALSLYRDLVTDSIWAYQRNNYGYKNLRSFPLMVDFLGLPYIDVRVSFNSFVPRDISNGLADRLVSYYISRLVSAPTLHDRVEFDIVFSCYTFDLPQRLNRLSEFGFSAAERERLANSLRALTNRIIDRDTGLWRTDSEKIETLEQRRATILESLLDPISKMYWLLEDCKRYGTLPFAGLARAGFIAVQLLRSLVAVGVIDEREYDAFMAGLDTVSGRLVRDLNAGDRETFLSRYGHLRPGTYDILSPRYDEAPDQYFDWERKAADSPERADVFTLSIAQMRDVDRLLKEHGFTHEIVGLFDFLRAAIEGREYAKFAFTRNLSDVLKMLGELGFSKDDVSYADVGCIRELYSGSGTADEVFTRSIERGKTNYERAKQVVLPPLIVDPAQVWSFEMPLNEPHYITQGAAQGRVCTEDTIGASDAELSGAIVFIRSADPGYDWLFSHKIAGFVTAYGGVNSHMAIRAGELNLPAVIGAGETLFNRWSSAKHIRIDAGNQHVEMLG